MSVKTAKIFMNGRSQAIRLPKEYRFDTQEVYIRKQGGDVIISAKHLTWDEFFDTPSVFGDDFLNERQDDITQEREFD